LATTPKKKFFWHPKKTTRAPRGIGEGKGGRSPAKQQKPQQPRSPKQQKPQQPRRPKQQKPQQPRPPKQPATNTAPFFSAPKFAPLFLFSFFLFLARFFLSATGKSRLAGFCFFDIYNLFLNYL